MNSKSKRLYLAQLSITLIALLMLRPAALGQSAGVVALCVAALSCAGAGYGLYYKKSFEQLPAGLRIASIASFVLLVGYGVVFLVLAAAFRNFGT